MSLSDKSGLDGLRDSRSTFWRYWVGRLLALVLGDLLQLIEIYEGQRKEQRRFVTTSQYLLDQVS
jgi:hypothetical protein